MDGGSLNKGAALAATLTGAGLLPASAPSGQGAKAAREFEAQLIATVLESLEKSFASVPGENSPAGSDNYNYLGTQALSSAIAAGGGFGIARMIEQHFGPTTSTAKPGTPR